MRKPKETEEERTANCLKFELQRLREGYIPELHSNALRYKVGDRIHHGNIKKSIVTEVLDGGKIYKLHENFVENHYGKMIPGERDIYVDWISICPYRTGEELKAIETLSDPKSLDLQFSNRTVEGLLHMAYYFGIDLNADYQRGSVWTIEDKVALIESIFRHIEIGKFAIIHLPYKDHSPSYEMLDGKQRLIALMDYYEGKFKCRGKFYWELNFFDQHAFRNHPIAIGECQNERITQKMKYDYFLRLNTSGKPQDPEHLKKVKGMLDGAK